MPETNTRPFYFGQRVEYIWNNTGWKPATFKAYASPKLLRLDDGQSTTLVIGHEFVRVPKPPLPKVGDRVRIIGPADCCDGYKPMLGKIGTIAKRFGDWFTLEGDSYPWDHHVRDSVVCNHYAP